MDNVSDRYLAYMLRLWRVDSEQPLWRASLEDARTGERRGFGSLEMLFQFLIEQMGGSSEAGLDAAETREVSRSDSGSE